MSFTIAQQEAIVARGNVLMVAGAGTGKTSTLVERCLGCLLDPQTPASLDEILMVTFTDAAAAEMRQRIRLRLEARLASHADDLRWPEQLALFETAHIGTLHSFCLELVRQHFYELELDPQLTVLPEEEAKLLADETLETIFQTHYKGETSAAEAVQQLIQTHARGWDLPIRRLVLRLHHYTQTLRDPEGWFASQLAMFQSGEPAQWRVLLGGRPARLARTLAAGVARRPTENARPRNARRFWKIFRRSRAGTIRRRACTDSPGRCQLALRQNHPLAQTPRRIFRGGGIPEVGGLR